MKEYKPNPIDTSDVVLPDELLKLTEKLAENTHEVWASNRISQGWSYGEERNDAKKLTPCMVPYSELPEEEKDYDRNTALETIRLIIKLGYTISPQ
ncbi:RyR domain-containing protein [Ruminococcaceae bacterium P7]|nr:RyR domain-containing protein [Ruminococcaceae bacterium P7]